MLNTALAADIPGITLVSPPDGTIVRPGESVLFEVEVDPNLLPAEVIVLHPDMRYPTTATLAGPPFAGYLPIPDEATGPMRLLIGVVPLSDGDFTGWATLTLKAIPLETPVRLDAGDTMYLSYPISEYETRQILVDAYYADESSKDVTLGMVGTTYVSSDPTVVTVDQDGVLTTHGLGLAYIVIEHQGVRTYQQVIVNDPANERLRHLASIEYTSQALINTSGFRRDPGTAFFVQQVSVYNDTELPFPRPLHLMISESTQPKSSHRWEARPSFSTSRSAATSRRAIPPPSTWCSGIPRACPSRTRSGSSGGVAICKTTWLKLQHECL